MPQNSWKGYQVKEEKYHKPVFLREILKVGAPLNNKRIIDATLGTGGHTLEYLKRGCSVLSIERDKEALEISKLRIKKEGFSDKSILVWDNFKNIRNIAQKNDYIPCDVVLFDLGVSTPQLKSPTRGFSFTDEKTELDMRVDKINQGPKAYDLLNALRKDQLIELFGRVLNKKESGYIANLIVNRRKIRQFKTVGDFLAVCKGIKTKKTLHFATLPLLALRISVNSEFENLSEALWDVIEIIKKGGYLLIISFHSGEELIVDKFIKKYEKEGLAEFCKRYSPSETEVNLNPSSRSAKLTVIRKI